MGLNPYKYIIRLFKPNNYFIEEIDYEDGDAHIIFYLDGKKYNILLEWGESHMDIEFFYDDDVTLDTTNFKHHYRLLKTIHDIIHKIAKKITKKTYNNFVSISFGGSYLRNGVYDEKAKEIRDKFFIKYAKIKYPNAKVYKTEEEDIFIKLK